MIYVMSDLHGCFDEYLAMLEKIKFSEKDTLYIIGDVIDRGPHPIEILKHTMEHDNIILLLGNHELMMSQRLHLIDEEGNVRPGLVGDDLKKGHNWVVRNKGFTTSREWARLTKEEQARLLDYLLSLPAYQEIAVEGKQYVLVHGGFEDFSEDKPLTEYTTYDLVWKRIKMQNTYFRDKIIISGHTPTVNYGEAYEGKMILMKDKLLIDCGYVYGCALGCLCLNTMEEFYIENLR